MAPVREKGPQELQKLAIRFPAAMGTLMYMVNRMSRSNALVVSQRAIAEDLGITRESVNRAVKHLVDHNFVQVIKAAGASVYVVNARVAWQETVGPGMPLLGLMSSPWKASKREAGQPSAAQVRSQAPRRRKAAGRQ